MNSEEWKQPYYDYLRSPEWAKKRAAAITRAKNKCQRCGRSGEVLHVHHLTYDRLFNELAKDLKVVCVKCHQVEDDLRIARQIEQATEISRDLWARRCYGDDYKDRVDPLRVIEEYARFCEKIGDMF